jgi:hypothetical protein
MPSSRDKQTVVTVSRERMNFTCIEIAIHPVPWGKFSFTACSSRYVVLKLVIVINLIVGHM